MIGVITRREVLSHPFVILESFGARVLVRALTSGPGETFLDVVSRCEEEEAHRAEAEVDLEKTVGAFQGFELRARDLYRSFERIHSGLPAVAAFFRTLAGHEEGHAVVLAQVRHALRHGRCWKHSLRAFREEMARVAATLASAEAEAVPGITLARTLELAEALEASEINVVFDTLRGSVDLRSRARFEGFFVMTEKHLSYCREQVRALREAHGVPAKPGT